MSRRASIPELHSVLATSAAKMADGDPNGHNEVKWGARLGSSIESLDQLEFSAASLRAYVVQSCSESDDATRVTNGDPHD